MKTATFRNALLRKCMEMGMPGSTILELVEPMHGKTDDEKERIAREILERLQGEKKKSKIRD